MDRLIGFSIRPPMALARLGGSETPLESFEWVAGRGARGGIQTLIRPATSFHVHSNGEIEPYLPKKIRFKDDGAIRPVAPFFELWVTSQCSGDGTVTQRPLTLDLLAQYHLSLANLQFRVTAGNRKAERRTGSASCAFIGRVDVRGDDHEIKELLAVSPATSGQEPLVYCDHPVPLGSFRVLRPTAAHDCVGAEEVDLSVVRLRYTPAKGKVYGPPNAICGPASPLQPGQALAPRSQEGRIHEIVRPENRILNPNTPWSQFRMMTGAWLDTLPWDSYDGANVGEDRSWGCVDDTCDVLIEASLVVGMQRLDATARIFTGPPDYAPDRRPFYSIRDDLEDRDDAGSSDPPVSREEIVDLFHRVFEFASMLNLDAARSRAITENIRSLTRAGISTLPPSEQRPRTDFETMTLEDVPYVDKVPPLLFPDEPSQFSNSVANDQLPYTNILPFVHGPLSDEVVLLDFLRRRGDYIRQLMRPPFPIWRELPERAPSNSRPDRRDPRLLRDKLHDMRMPPYMRDSNFYSLSLTRRQYLRLMSFIAALEKQDAAGTEVRGEG